MMNCTQTQLNLIAYVRGQLESVQASDLIGHVTQCKTCRERLEEERLIQDMFRQYQVPAPRPDFESRILHQVVQAHERKLSFHKGLITALAACLVIWVSVMLVTPMTNDRSIDLPKISVTVNEVKNIRFTFNAPKDFNKVTINLKLPKHIELEGYPGEKELRWETALSEGANVLTLPVIATHANTGKIIARLSNGKKFKEFSINMTAMANQKEI